MSPKNAYSATVEIPAGSAPAVILRYSFGSSLYHRLVAQARDYRLSGKSSDLSWETAVRRIAELYLPLGPFNWFEYPLSQTESVSDFSVALSDRTALFAREFGEALALVAGDYQARFWQADLISLDRALDSLQNRLSPVKDALLTSLAHKLGLQLGNTPFEVTLVPHCHEPTGAYSHPTVIGVDCFEEISLVEVLLHELGHVMASRGHKEQAGGFATIRAVCERLGRNEQFAIELFHLFLFHAAGQIVRTMYDPNYTTLASRRNIYLKLGIKLGSRFTEHDIQAIWNRLECGEIELGIAVEELNTRLQAGTIQRPIQSR